MDNFEAQNIIRSDVELELHYIERFLKGKCIEYKEIQKTESPDAIVTTTNNDKIAIEMSLYDQGNRREEEARSKLGFQVAEKVEKYTKFEHHLSNIYFSISCNTSPPLPTKKKLSDLANQIAEVIRKYASEHFDLLVEQNVCLIEDFENHPDLQKHLCSIKLIWKEDPNIASLIRKNPPVIQPAVWVDLNEEKIKRIIEKKTEKVESYKKNIPHVSLLWLLIVPYIICYPATLHLHLSEFKDSNRNLISASGFDAIFIFNPVIFLNAEYKEDVFQLYP